MRIVHVAPLWLPVSIDSHGGIETFLAELLAAQHALGHDVVLVAAGDSDVPVQTVPVVGEALVRQMHRGTASEYEYYEQALLEAAADMGAGADVVHNHVLPAGLLLSALMRSATPVLHTLHGQVTVDLCWALRRSPQAVVGVSHAQRRTAVKWGVELFGVRHNGIDFGAVTWSADGGDRLLFLGRIEPQKGPDIAIQVARRCGMPLTLAGPVTDGKFFASVIEPQLGDGVTYAGALDREAKYEALRSSRCLLVPSRWSEPFGMVAVEAMASGTPVIARSSGALPEVVEDGVTGRVTDTDDALATAILDVANLDRRAIREHARGRFDITEVARGYVGHYERLLRAGVQ